MENSFVATVKVILNKPCNASDLEGNISLGITRYEVQGTDVFIDNVPKIKVNTYTTMPKTKEAFEALIIAANKSGFYRPEDAANFQPSKVPRYLLTKGKQVLILSDLSREQIDHDIDNNEWLMAGA
jgi:hypothetical protein